MNTLAAFITWMSVLVFGTPAEEAPPPPAEVHAVSNTPKDGPPKPAPTSPKGANDRIYVGF